MSVTFVTSNEDKVREAEAILDMQLERESIDLQEIQAVDVEDVARQKATDAYRTVDQPVIVEDTGLLFAALNGFPGALTKWALKTAGNEGLCNFLDDYREATAVTVIGYADGNEIQTFKGEVSGEIAYEPRGDYDFGWDPIFIPDGYTETFGELGPTVKNEMSMRKKALTKLDEYLQ